ncbi:nucleotidyltransferase substrate binding protein [Leptolyngbya cf. ectocarpi LEGE 11479]|uniref:Nucleotidyltransferase substrate binding protein n=1 Tax=Leptolyngbya cf. ectocarpi LEGE 11479 TaxID=1828722 RepID=A0A928ZZA4_LEPEC|nr:nucleotidyltransferase substrate binding protein [Leptolyngbya ectocarpi]MBE9070171.1 nucleotidyltransferase substrate binding protein [Leptolyngbya cf. ectocarpi LEGE 11479]
MTENKIESNQTPDIRWKQRFANYKRALTQLTKFIDKGELNELEEQGLIQAFEYTHELAWNVLKDYLQYQGNQNIYGSRDATRLAFNVGLLEDGTSWMDMIKERNRTSHTYNQATARAIAENIKGRFFTLFVQLQTKMQALQDAE